MKQKWLHKMDKNKKTQSKVEWYIDLQYEG